MTVVDAVVATIPRSVPAQAALRNCKIISHRGEHDNRRVMENTLEAFDNARRAGVWGIEADIRWTVDRVPVICHDPAPARVFGVEAEVSSLTFAQLRAQAPLVPSLAELLDAFAGNTHLMLEIKAEPWTDPLRQREILSGLLAPWNPGHDYHFLALQPDLFSLVDFVPPSACFPVAEVNVARLSRCAIERGYGGLFGHYLLLTKRLKQQHETLGQRVGSGFPGSKNALFRELNRGVEWIFSNDAVKLQEIRDRYLQNGPGGLQNGPGGLQNGPGGLERGSGGTTA